MQKKIRKAIIPAAGLGTRFLPATKAQPKEMLPIVDKPAIQFIIEEAIASGIEEILVITGRNKRSIEDHFDRSLELELQLKAKGKYEMLKTIEEISSISLHFIRQKEARGLGHAVLCAKQFVGDEPFAVLLGDDLVDAEVPCLAQLIKAYDDLGGSILGVQKVPHSQVCNYGIVDPIRVKDNVWLAKNLVEKPILEKAPSDLAVLGRYILVPQIFDILEHTTPGSGNEIQLTDAICELSSKQKVFALNFSGRRYDIGDKEGFLEATVEYALKRPELRDRFMAYMLRTMGPLLKAEKGISEE
ncbi:UTP--glucose-1-phosphate uridylyltransferase GalU [Pectinatus haikarae]|uniref:UTP--glucose-1-phosphate uridylyltransferase n=2 Tax=Pectinatus TaxID=864 RepID=A0ABT9Y485_9FIRM|nr:UTP--glucose-1-phosphate uridylyltransferase GalU [Pectinatus haikarae]MDQ0202541.1 UTP--glucose-1-phosphate uridylyltransferase [Pectinatus haikarae]